MQVLLWDEGQVTSMEQCLRVVKQDPLPLVLVWDSPKGNTSYISPTLEITQTGEKHTIDGVEIEFQLTPGTEAPAEMNFWIGSENALWMAENCTETLHNLYTLRGAQVRDGNAWAEYIMESLALYGDKAEGGIPVP